MMQSFQFRFKKELKKRKVSQDQYSSLGRGIQPLANSAVTC